MLVSFLVQLQSQKGSLAVELVKFLQVQFCFYDVPSHLKVLLVGGVLLTCDDHCPWVRQQLQARVAEQLQTVVFNVKFLVMWLSFLVQLQSRTGNFPGTVTFLQEQFWS